MLKLVSWLTRSSAFKEQQNLAALTASKTELDSDYTTHTLATYAFSQKDGIHKLNDVSHPVWECVEFRNKLIHEKSFMVDIVEKYPEVRPLLLDKLGLSAIPKQLPLLLFAYKYGLELRPLLTELNHIAEKAERDFLKIRYKRLLMNGNISLLQKYTNPLAILWILALFALLFLHLQIHNAPFVPSLFYLVCFDFLLMPSTVALAYFAFLRLDINSKEFFPRIKSVFKTYMFLTAAFLLASPLLFWVPQFRFLLLTLKLFHFILFAILSAFLVKQYQQAHRFHLNAGETLILAFLYCQIFLQLIDSFCFLPFLYHPFIRSLYLPKLTFVNILFFALFLLSHPAYFLAMRKRKTFTISEEQQFSSSALLILALLFFFAAQAVRLFNPAPMIPKFFEALASLIFLGGIPLFIYYNRVWPPYLKLTRADRKLLNLSILLELTFLLVAGAFSFWGKSSVALQWLFFLPLMLWLQIFWSLYLLILKPAIRSRIQHLLVAFQISTFVAILLFGIAQFLSIPQSLSLLFLLISYSLPLISTAYFAYLNFHFSGNRSNFPSAIEAK